MTPAEFVSLYSSGNLELEEHENVYGAACRLGVLTPRVISFLKLVGEPPSIQSRFFFEAQATQLYRHTDDVHIPRTQHPTVYPSPVKKILENIVCL